jgi:hypothetical protein
VAKKGMPLKHEDTKFHKNFIEVLKERIYKYLTSAKIVTRILPTPTSRQKAGQALKKGL